MRKNSSIFAPMEFESPVEFILVGVEEKKRAIVAKSIGAKLDLAAYAQQQQKYDINSNFTKSILFKLGLYSADDLKPFIIDSVPTKITNNIQHDSRATELTFVWRGSTPSGSELNSIKKVFDIRANEISDAIDKKSQSQLEWLLSPIIDDCNKIIIKEKKKKFLYRFSFLFISLNYLIFIIYYMYVRGLL
ncbi:hypothetical protein [Aeromonas bestiarum]|uniref:hypothetical protein n=1 Tax=Aeromonas bestiarum TaxID=105751 RepID=UPI003D2236BB